MPLTLFNPTRRICSTLAVDHLQVPAFKTARVFGWEDYLSPNNEHGESSIHCATRTNYLPVLARTRKTPRRSHHSKNIQLTHEPSATAVQMASFFVLEILETSWFTHAQAAESINGRSHPTRSLSRLRVSSVYFFYALDHEAQSCSYYAAFFFAHCNATRPRPTSAGVKGTDNRPYLPTSTYRSMRCTAVTPRFRARCLCHVRAPYEALHLRCCFFIIHD